MIVIGQHELQVLFYVVLGLIVLGLSFVGGLFALSFDRKSNKGNNFYPTQYEINLLLVKLMFGPLTKGSTWKKLVKQDSPTLDSDSLTRVIPFIPNASHVQEFKDICSLKEEGSTVPLLYPSVIVLYPNSCLFADSKYPFPAIGSVHVYNTTAIAKPLLISEELTCVLTAGKSIRHAKKGSEVEFISSLLDSEKQTVWRNSSKFLVLHNERKKLAPPEEVVWPEPALTDRVQLFEDFWILGPNASKVYASVSKDYNPIHTSNIAAKLFGFQGIIMHGMYLITRAASECAGVAGDKLEYPYEVSTKFTRPCVLPQKLTFRVYSLKSQPKHLYFAVTNKQEKIHLDGYLKMGVRISQ